MYDEDEDEQLELELQELDELLDDANVNIIFSFFINLLLFNALIKASIVRISLSDGLKLFFSSIGFVTYAKVFAAKLNN